MGIFSFIKGKKQAEKSKQPSNLASYKPSYEPIPRPVPEPVISIQLEAYAEDHDGSIIKLPFYTTLNDGTCLIADDGKYYHTYIGCGATCAHWKLVTIEEAEKAGYAPCLMCEDEKRENRW